LAEPFFDLSRYELRDFRESKKRENERRVTPKNNYLYDLEEELLEMEV
jgi:hypothetical protein